MRQLDKSEQAKAEAKQALKLKYSREEGLQIVNDKTIADEAYEMQWAEYGKVNEQILYY